MEAKVAHTGCQYRVAQQACWPLRTTHLHVCFTQTRLDVCWAACSREQRQCSHAPQVNSITCSTYNLVSRHSICWLKKKVKI